MISCSVNSDIENENKQEVVELTQPQFIKVLEEVDRSTEKLDSIRQRFEGSKSNPEDPLAGSRKCYVLSLIHFRYGERERSYELIDSLYNQAVISEELEPLVNRLLAILNFYDGNYSKSFTLIDNAIRLNKARNDTLNLIKDYSNKSSVLHAMGEFESALEQQKLSIRFADGRFRESHRRASIEALAPIYLELGQLDSAEKYLLTIINSANEYELDAGTAVNLGRLFELKEEYEKADSVYYSALDSGVFDTDSLNLILLLNNIAYNAYNQGDYETAFLFLDSLISVENAYDESETSKSLKRLELQYVNLKKDLALANFEKEAKQSRLRFISVAIALIVLSLIGLLIILNLRTKMKAQRRISALRIEQGEKQKEVAAMHASLEAVDFERARIGADLHDGIGVLASLGKLRLSQFDGEKNPEERDSILTDVVDALNDIHTDTKRITFDLMPASLNNLGLTAATEELAEKLSRAHGMPIEVETQDLGELNDTRKLIVYRIVQELLNNGIKHSRATKISLRLYNIINALSINYQDNGIGMNSSSTSEDSSGFGLRILKSRVQRLSGHIDIDGRNGTIITINIPYE